MGAKGQPEGQLVEAFLCGKARQFGFYALPELKLNAQQAQQPARTTRIAGTGYCRIGATFCVCVRDPAGAGVGRVWLA